MSKSIPIMEAVRTLRAGDIITGFACDSCATNELLVLKRHADDSFDFSVRATTITLVLDESGPFRWNAGLKTFTGKGRHPYDHISDKSRVIVGGGMTELGWYEGLPSSEDAPFRINPENLLGHGVNPATMAKVQALLGRADSPTKAVQNLQHAVQTALGGITLSEEQMRCMLLVLNTHTLKQLRVQAMKSEMGDLLMGAVLGGGLADLIRGTRPRHTRETARHS